MGLLLVWFVFTFCVFFLVVKAALFHKKKTSETRVMRFREVRGLNIQGLPQSLISQSAFVGSPLLLVSDRHGFRFLRFVADQNC